MWLVDSYNPSGFGRIYHALSSQKNKMKTEIRKDETKITILLEKKNIEVLIKYPKRSQLKHRIELLDLLKKNLFKI